MTPSVTIDTIRLCVTSGSQLVGSRCLAHRSSSKWCTSELYLRFGALRDGTVGFEPLWNKPSAYTAAPTADEAATATTDTLPPYTPTGACQKCGGDDVSTTYDKGCHPSSTCTDHPEYMVRSCRRCHYQWHEAPVSPTT